MTAYLNLYEDIASTETLEELCEVLNRYQRYWLKHRDPYRYESQVDIFICEFSLPLFNTDDYDGVWDEYSYDDNNSIYRNDDDLFYIDERGDKKW